MKSSTTYLSTVAALRPLEEAFDLEVSCLSLLLKRHYAQHHRSRYFRHLSMIVRCIHQNSISQLAQVIRSTGFIKDAWIREYERSISPLLRKNSLNQNKSNSDATNDVERKVELEEEDKWDTTTNKDNTNDVIPGLISKSFKRTKAPLPPSSPFQQPETMVSTKKHKKQILEESLAYHIQWLHCILTQYLPILQDRIQSTSKMIYPEMAKGYFLPFFSVVIGTLARIRVIILRWGREGVAQCMDVSSSLFGTEKLTISPILKNVLLKYCIVDPKIWMKQYMEIDVSWHPTTKNYNINSEGKSYGDYTVITTDEDKGNEMTKIMKQIESKSYLHDLKTIQSSLNIKNNDDGNANTIDKIQRKKDINDGNDEDFGELVHIGHNNDGVKLLSASISALPTVFETSNKSSNKATKLNHNNDFNHESNDLDSEVKFKTNKDEEKHIKNEKGQTNQHNHISQTNMKNHDTKNQSIEEKTKTNSLLVTKAKKRKKAKKKKEENSKKKRKKSKSTRDVFDEIFDSL